MKTASLFARKQVLSFEVFPPRRSAPVDTIYRALAGMCPLEPDFISVTFGAGGRANSHNTLEIATAIQVQYGIPSVAHLPGAYLTREDVLQLLEQLKAAGIVNILALRGDRVEGSDSGAADSGIPGDFPHASDLITFIRRHGDFNIIGACYPEGHPESGGIIQDLRHLRTKVDAGADQLIGQLCFDNDLFYAFLERAQIAGINVPISAGIMPVVNERQIARMVSLCKVQLPRKYLAIMDRYRDNPEAMRDAGIAYAIDQIVDLIAQGAAGIHLYTMNNPDVAVRIVQAIKRLLAA